jgi:hypothetical protein
MPRFEVRNKLTMVVMGEVVVEHPEDVLDALAATTQSTVEQIAWSLGKSLEEAKVALEIVEIPEPHKPSGKRKLVNALPPRPLFS